MKSVNSWIPFVTTAVSLVFAAVVFQRYLRRRGSHLLVWSIGLLFYAMGGLSEGYIGLFGWNPLVFRLWYLLGAMLLAAWLGQGTVYLLAPRGWAHALMGILLLGSAYGLLRVFTAELDPSRMAQILQTRGELSGNAIVTGGVRSLTPIFNIYGTIALVGGAIWSAVIFWRKRVFPHRLTGNILIAAGALLPASGGAFSRFGLTGMLYLLELLGAVLMFIGFIRATIPVKEARA